ncbi:MAG TPA: helix-turn-helix domain-containing protein [Nonomuraea sp.]|nr:helix-turn-helix domain-containing protein [Nonomuraea sp.]
MTSSAGDKWLRVPALAKQLGVTIPTLYRILDSGQLPAYKIGRVLRLRRMEVMAYVERCRITPGSLGHLYPPGDKGGITPSAEG